MPDKTDAEKAQVQTAAEFFQTLIRMVKEHQAAVTKSTLVTAALLQAITDKFPEIGSAYESYLAQSEKYSPLAQQSRQIIAELDLLTAQMKAAEPQARAAAHSAEELSERAEKLFREPPPSEE